MGVVDKTKKNKTSKSQDGGTSLIYRDTREKKAKKKKNRARAWQEGQTSLDAGPWGAICIRTERNPSVSFFLSSCLLQKQTNKCSSMTCLLSELACLIKLIDLGVCRR